MSTVATTIRLEPKAQAALQNLSKVTKRPMNKLVTEAITAFVHQRSVALEQELEGMVASLRAHRRSDPRDEKAIAAFAKAEVTHADPAEGKVVKSAAANKPRAKHRSRAHA
jgi:predicted transcriptional regulator